MVKKDDDLLEEISEYLFVYLKAGKIRINSFIKKLQLNVENLDQLLTIHFLLKEEVQAYIQDLPKMIKRFNTTTIIHNEISKGEVRGQIDWQLTITERLNSNPEDLTIYSTNENIRSYDTQENIVLKEFISILYKGLYENDYIQNFKQTNWFVDLNNIRKNTKDALKYNIYLQRVAKGHVTDRMIVRTMKHRNTLYSKAAKLLGSYRRLMNGYYDTEEIVDLLKETFIAPDRKEVLFELYWVIQFIKQNSNDTNLFLIDGKQNKVATWQKEERTFHLYHDSHGSGELTFNVPLEEIRESGNSYLIQKVKAIEDSKTLVETIFGRSIKQGVWNGRPDILIEVYDNNTNELVEVIIGEVKLTDREEYAITGLKELLEYKYLIKNKKSGYIKEVNSPVKGFLLLNDVPFKDSNDASIKVINKHNKEKLIL